MSAPKPPRKALTELRRLGYAVKAADWNYIGNPFNPEDEGHWVGYPGHSGAICTISTVTGKALVEVCKQAHYVEVLL